MSFDENANTIYVADLAEYNNGRLIGIFINLDEVDSGDEIGEKVKEFLDKRGHEEWAVHDYDGLIGSLGSMFGEYPDFDELVEVARVLREHGQAYVDYADDIGEIPDEQDFEDAYCGEWNSGAEYAEELITECYALDEVPEVIGYHIDWEGIWRDMRMDGYSISENGYVFRS